jgi:hypothetical protein
VDSAFIDGFHAGSWVSVVIVLFGALIALRFLPRRAASVRADAVETHAGLEDDTAGVEVAPAL